MFTLPHVIPDGYQTAAGVVTGTPVDTGGYDILLGGAGFRLASSQTFPYTRESDQMTTQRVDQSPEPGEQSLTPLPWLKSQSSFHGGAGQLNLEPAEPQPGDISHLRFDMSRNADVWTPGMLKRLPDTTVTALGVTPSCMISAADASGNDYVYTGGVGGFYLVSWASGVNSAATVTQINLTGSTTNFVSNANCTLLSLACDGASYYALLRLSTVNTAGYHIVVCQGAVGTSTTPTVLYGATSTTTSTGVLGWVKARLMLGLDNSLYELGPAGPALPAAKYVSPTSAWRWSAISESPTGVLASGDAWGSQSSILKLELDTTGETPTLVGGATIAALPAGECVKSLSLLAGSFLVLGTTRGVRVGTFDTYTGSMKYGPLNVVTNSPVLCSTGRDHFTYAGYTNGNEDGTTGLVRIDLGEQVDQAGRLAWAPDLTPPPTAPTGLGSVTGVAVLPASGRLAFVAPDGVHLEGNGPGSLSDSYLRTSRIRFGTTESKLFLLGRVRGDFTAGEVSVVGGEPYGGSVALGPFGFVVNQDPPEFTLPSSPTEWLQLKLDLIGAPVQVTSYQVKALPAAARQRVITLTVWDMTKEQDRFGLSDIDQVIPRNRMLALETLERTGAETQLVEFTPLGPVSTTVVIEQMKYIGQFPPSKTDDFGGTITIQMRTTRL